MLYAFTIFVSAFLLFQVQPIIAKMILPWFGGGAAVWTTCMLFFQLLLVGGYLYAHWTTRSLSARTQAIVHGVLLAVAAVALPIIPDATWKPLGDADPGLYILGLLAVTVGLPYFVLSTTGPLVQVWFSRANHGAMPYRLYALSNVGSMLALLTYPIAVEPWLPTRAQAFGWSGAFVVFAIACGVLAWRSRGAAWEVTAGAPAEAAARPTAGRYLLWAALAGTASVLLLAFTSQLSQNVAPIPFIWVLPLALYLLSFILTFDGRGWYSRKVYLPLAAAGLVGVTALLHSDFRHSQLWVMLPVYAATLFVACMVCHGELVRLTPPPRYLTGFYLAISVGGALGGVFVGLIAPRIFLDLYELPAGLVAMAAVVAVVLALDQTGFPGVRTWRAAVFGAVLLAGGLAGTLWWIYDGYARDANVRVRNFYAAMRVWDSGDGEAAQRVLTHGSITHGKQFTKPEQRKRITTYYGETSGVGRAILAAGLTGPGARRRDRPRRGDARRVRARRRHVPAVRDQSAGDRPRDEAVQLRDRLARARWSCRSAMRACRSSASPRSASTCWRWTRSRATRSRCTCSPPRRSRPTSGTSSRAASSRCTSPIATSTSSRCCARRRRSSAGTRASSTRTPTRRAGCTARPGC